MEYEITSPDYVIEKYWDINVSDSLWSELETESFKESILAEYGTVKDIMFDLYHNHCHFEYYNPDIDKVIRRNLSELIKLTFPEVYLLRRKIICIPNRISFELYEDIDFVQEEYSEKIDKYLDKLTEIIDSEKKELEQQFLIDIKGQYDYLTSVDAITEAVITNGLYPD